MNNILIIGAHYDDTELGCGGTAAKLAAQGKNNNNGGHQYRYGRN